MPRGRRSLHGFTTSGNFFRRDVAQLSKPSRSSSSSRLAVSELDIGNLSDLSSSSIAMSEWDIGKTVRTFACGGVAGSVGILVSQPFDVIRIKMQTTLTSAQNTPGVMSCMRQVLKADGVRGFYKGIAAPIVTVGARNALMFVGYDVALKSMGTSSSTAKPSELLLAGLCSGLVAAPITSASELVKIRVQVSQNVSGGSLSVLEWQILRNLWMKEGIAGFACGMQLTAARDVVYRSIYFAFYETLARSMTGEREQRPAWVSLCAG